MRPCARWHPRRRRRLVCHDASYLPELAMHRVPNAVLFFLSPAVTIGVENVAQFFECRSFGRFPKPLNVGTVQGHPQFSSSVHGLLTCTSVGEVCTPTSFSLSRLHKPEHPTSLRFVRGSSALYHYLQASYQLASLSFSYSYFFYFSVDSC